MMRPVVALANVAARLAAVGLTATIGACASSRPPVDATRFRNRAPVWVVDDRRQVTHRPRTTPTPDTLYHYDGIFSRRFDRWMEMQPHRRARSRCPSPPPG